MKFTVAAYDADTYSSLSDSLCNEGRGAYTLVRIDAHTTWRELQTVLRTITKGLMCIESASSVGLGVLNDKDTTTFKLADIVPVDCSMKTEPPQSVCDRKYAELTTTQITVDNDDLTALMKLLPLGNSSHSGLREKLHQASIAINKKR